MKKKQDFSTSISEANENVFIYLYLFQDWFPLEFVFIDYVSLI